jgi:CheY-like chemotaxis protein
MNKKKILVVDDDAVVIRALSIKLEASGFEVLTAMDGAQAVTAVRTQKPDLILLDLTFPADMGGVSWDGFLIMEWLKRLEEATNVPIIVITGGDREQYERRALAAGATAFFHKPIDHDELFGLIRRTLNLETVTV